MVAEGKVHGRPGGFQPVVAAEDGDEPDCHVAARVDGLVHAGHDGVHRPIPIQASGLAEEMGREPELGQPDVLPVEVLDGLAGDPAHCVVGADRALGDGETRQGVLQAVDRRDEEGARCQLGRRSPWQRNAGLARQIDDGPQPERTLQVPVELHLGGGAEIQ